MNAPAAPVVSPGIRDEFPGWIPAMLVKELRQALRAKGFVGLFLVFHLVAIVVFWWTIEINSASGLRETFTWLNGAFWTLLNVVMLLVVPLRGLGSLRMELDNKTLDLLVLTRLTAWRIVLGKWVALVAQGALFLLAVMPYGVVRYFFGSVDLARDLVLAGWLFLASAALAAICLWISGLPKLFRVMLPVLLFMSFQSLGMATAFSAIMSGRSGLGRGIRTPFENLGATGVSVLGLVMLIFLGLAVRRIAPPAENHAKWARLLGLVLLGVTLIIVSVTYIGRGEMLAFGFITVMLISAVELSRDCLPMRPHWSPWSQGGAVRAWFGRLLLPGWPSAALFAAVALGVFVAALLLVPSLAPSGTDGLAMAWWLVLGWQALVFPALLLSFLPAASSMRVGGSGYFVVQGLFGTISLLAATNSTGYITGEDFARALEAICRLLPVFSFWLGVDSVEHGFASTEVIGQVATLAGLIVLVRRQSRLYWGTVARYDRRGDEVAASTP
ncbi:MAG TPA: hypothetical protein VG734_10935 [Lacunisphaera sp.]|nr:hypothetical protein [Lacunisphaera sp.]